jgi:hypothetical protein
MADNSGKKARLNAEKGDQVTDAAIDLLNAAGIKAEATQNHDKKGDIRLPKGQGDKAGKIIVDTVEANRKNKNS